MHVRTLWIAPLLLTLASGCMTRSEHDRLMSQAYARSTRLRSTHETEMAAAQSQSRTLQEELVRLQQEMAARDKQIEALNLQAARLQRRVDDDVALNDQLRQELQRAGKNVDSLLTERGSLAQSLDDTKARLAELRKAQEAANQRAELFRQLLLKFKNMVDSGDLAIVVRDGRMVLQLRNDVLFDSGKVGLKDDGEQALTEMADILMTFDDRKLQVAGHTDSVPISNSRFPSNWELSTARAVNVVKYLIERGVKPELLSAAGYGPYDPVSANDTSEGKAKNRRIEITLQPNLAELVQVPDVP